MKGLSVVEANVVGIGREVRTSRGQARREAAPSLLRLPVYVCALAITLVLLIPLSASAQGYGSISGTVTDTTGAAIPGAEVTATQATTGIVLKTVSGGEGNYVFPSLAPSVYNITVSRQGFQSYTEN